MSCVASGPADPKDPAYYWLGATDEATDGVWLWTNGAAATDMVVGKFADYQPNGGTDQNGLVIQWNGHQLHDRDCSMECFYVCEIDLS